MKVVELENISADFFSSLWLDKRSLENLWTLSIVRISFQEISVKIVLHVLFLVLKDVNKGEKLQK